MFPIIRIFESWGLLIHHSSMKILFKLWIMRSLLRKSRSVLNSKTPPLPVPVSLSHSLLTTPVPCPVWRQLLLSCLLPCAKVNCAWFSSPAASPPPPQMWKFKVSLSFSSIVTQRVSAQSLFRASCIHFQSTTTPSLCDTGNGSVGFVYTR